VGKVVFWIVVFFLVLLALRLLSVHKTRREERERRDAQTPGRRDDKPANDVMVKCGRCGVFVPRSTTQMTRSGIACVDPDCAKKR